MNGRVDIITGPERRRRWSNDEKLQLVAEACQLGNSVPQVHRQVLVAGWHTKCVRQWVYPAVLLVILKLSAILANTRDRK